MENQAFWNKNWAKWKDAPKPSLFAEKALKIMKIKDAENVLFNNILWIRLKTKSQKNNIIAQNRQRKS